MNHIPNRNTMKKILLSIALALLIAGCIPYREIMQTKSTNSKLTDDGFIYENDTVKITYHFWREDGCMAMKIYNKLSVPIFIDWKVSNFIDNGNNLQYWHDVQNSTAVSSGASYYGYHVGFGTSVTNATTEKPDRITSITPHTDIVKETYAIIPPNIRYTIPAGDYTFDNSPVKFRNYIALSMDEAFTQKFFIDNQFYVSHAEFIEENKFETTNTMRNEDAILLYPKNNSYFYSEAVTNVRQGQPIKSTKESAIFGQ